MADSPISPKASSYSPRSHLSPTISPFSSPQAWAWKSISPAVGPRKGLYAGRRGSIALDDDLIPPLSPKSKPSVPVPIPPHEEQPAASPLSPRYSLFTLCFIGWCLKMW